MCTARSPCCTELWHSPEVHSWPGLGLGVPADTPPADRPAADEANDKSAGGHSSACLALRASVLLAALESMAASLVLGTGWFEGAEGAGSGGAENLH